MKKNRQLKTKITIKQLLILCFLVIFAGQGYADDRLTSGNITQIIKEKTVTLNLKRKPILTILNDIQKQTAINFGFSKGLKSENMGLFDINVEKKSVKEAIDTLLANSKYSYRIVNDVILIVYRAESPKIIGQNRININGKVIDESDKPIVGATILVLGTDIGAISNNKGLFNFSAPENSHLEISFMGMKTLLYDKPLSSKEPLILKMKEDAMAVSDVVITGIFNKSKESYTGSVTTISSKEVKMFAGQNLLQTLKNIDPSINIRGNNEMGSDPNNMPEINIRGNSSLPVGIEELNNNAQAQMNTPLVIMDGFPISLQKLMDFNDEEIESISILKDASATSIYGSRGANGVIVVTTKSPVEGKLKIFIQASTNIEMPDLSSYNLMNSAEKLELENRLGFFNSPNGASNIIYQERYSNLRQEVLSGVDTYWLSKPLHVGVGQKYNLRLEGGSKEFKWSTSLGYNNITGAMKGSDKTIFNGAITLTYQMKNILFRNQTSIGITKGVNSPYGNFYDYAAMNPYWRTHDKSGALIKTYNKTNTHRDFEIGNPLYNATLNTINTNEYNDITNNFSIDWDIIEGLKATGRLGLSKTDSRTDKFKPANHTDFAFYEGDDYIRKGSYNYGTKRGFNYDINITLLYSKTFAERHNVYAGLDYSLSQQESEGVDFLLEGFSHPSLSYLSNALKYGDGKPSGSEDMSRSLGLTFSFNYTYDNKYFVDISGRMDGSSQFGSKNRFAPFFSVGAGWNLHKEQFLKDSKIINNLRLKGSIGQTGSQNFSPYQALTMYSFYDGDRYLSWNGAYIMGFGNEKLKWQITDEYNVGFEIGLFGTRLIASGDVYRKMTNSLLSQMNTQLSTGFRSYTDNIGQVSNTGVEVMLSGYLIRNTSRELFWSITTKLAHNKNKIEKLSAAVKAQNEEYILKDANNNLMFEGDALNSIYVVPSMGIDPSTGEELFIDKNGKVTYDWKMADRRYAGISEPKFRGNLSSMFTYRNLTLNVSFGFHWGGQQYNKTIVDKVELVKTDTRNGHTGSNSSDMSLNVDKRVLTDRWMQAGDIKPYRSLFISTMTQPSSRFVQNDNVFEMQSATLSYKLTNKWLVEKLRIQSLTLGCNMSDIFYVSTIKRERGISYPFARRVGFSLALMF